jgi:murein DD-endopeptidase MepM/ murein hydrolase activator NlpD
LLDRPRAGAGRQSLTLSGAGKAIHIEDLESDHHNPFGTSFTTSDEPTHNRWMLTTCVAGIAGSMVIGSALLGFLGEDVTDASLASLSPTQLWQRTQDALKGDYNGEIAKAVALKPYREVSVAFRPNEEALGTVILPAREITGSLRGEYPSVTANALPYGTGIKPTVLEGTIQLASLDTQNITTIAKTPPPEPVDSTLTLAKGETLQDRLVGLGITIEAAKALVGAIEPVYPAVLIKPGQLFEITLDKQQDFYGNDVIFPVRVAFSPGPNEQILVESDEDGQFVARLAGEKEGARSRYASSPQYRTKAKISSSLYATAKDQGVPDYIIAEMMRIYAYDIDFQRQVRAGDEFELFYGNPITGTSRNRKVLLYASLDSTAGTKMYYRFTTPDDGQTDYYDEKGRSATKALAKTPVSGARLTSGFGMRKHPLLGYSKMHVGVDFGAPPGTPIKASGNGAVEYAGRNGSYGNVVRIKHPDGYETLYAHMSRLAENIAAGTKVNQGQIIGYVGATGRATGPHLHYEVRLNNKPVNPLKVRVAGGRQLQGEILKAFLEHKNSILAMMKNAPSTTRVAQNQ